MQSTHLALVSGLAPGAKLRENRMVEFSPRGLKFRGEMTFEQWKELLGLWRVVKTAYHAGLGDILAYGRERWGEDAVKECLVQYDFDLNDELHALAIGQIPLDLRSQELTPEHYFVLGKCLDNDADRARWQTAAVKHNLTAYELQKSIEAGKVVKGEELKAEQGRNSGILTIQSLVARMDMWHKRVGGEQGILAMPVEAKKQLLHELELPARIYSRLQAELGEEGRAS